MNSHERKALIEIMRAISHIGQTVEEIGQFLPEEGKRRVKEGTDATVKALGDAAQLIAEGWGTNEKY